jgi:Zn-dependent protease
MKQSLRLGRVAGIPIGVQWSALAIIVLIALTLAMWVLPVSAPGRPTAVYWAAAIPAAGLFLACLLAHELAHSLVALRKGVRVRSITLWMLGGISEMEDESPDPKADLAIAAAGPLTSLGLGALFGLATLGSSVLNGPALLTGALGWLAAINIVLGLFNLLPGAPLDGGRVLRAILWRRYHDRARADLAAANAGRALGFTLILAGLTQFLFLRVTAGLWTMIMGWFLMNAAQAEATSRTVREALKDLRVRDIMTPEPACGAAWHTVESFIDQVLLTSRQSVFPVLDFDGTPIGVVSTELLAAIPQERRPNARLGDIAVPLTERYICEPDIPATDLFTRRPLAGGLIAVVRDNGRVIGMVTRDDLTRTVQRGLLRQNLPPASSTAS